MNLFKDEQGLSLLEILLSIALLAIVIIPMSVLFGNMALYLELNEQRNTALMIAQREIENIKIMAFDEVISANLPVNLSPTSISGVTYTITDFVRNIRADLREIRVVVDWDDNMGVNRDIELVTFIADR